MRICFLADARSPIYQAWAAYFHRRGFDVRVISSYPCAPDAIQAHSVHVVPIAFSGLVVSPGGARADGKRASGMAALVNRVRRGSFSWAASGLRNWVGPIEMLRHVGEIRRLVDRIQPDLVHAMRIPFEGMAAALAAPAAPLLVSVWGNDFTLYAPANPLLGALTRRVMRRADALHVDCARDLRLARVWGYDASKPAVVLPGSGGVDLAVFHPGPEADENVDLGIRPDQPVVINPRGIRAYVRNDTFFQAIPLVLERRANTVFLCCGMRGEPLAERWVARLGIAHAVRLLPGVPRDRLAGLFRLAQVSVSPSVHDGTPNTLLEAMACGSLPVLGDIESIREWVTDGVNGLLCDPGDPASLAEAILRALGDPGFRRAAAAHNAALIAQRAEYHTVMAGAEQFYLDVVGKRVTPGMVGREDMR